MNLIGFSLLSILAIHQSFSCILVPGQSDACGHIDVVQGISVYDVKGLWYLQNIFFTNLLPPNATKGVHVIMNPINCSTIKEETVYLDPADYEHHYPVFLKLIQGLNVAQQYQPSLPGVFYLVGFSQNKYLIAYYCYFDESSGETISSLKVYTKEKFVCKSTLIEINFILKRFKINSLEQGIQIEQVDWYPNGNSYIYTKVEPLKAPEPQFNKPRGVFIDENEQNLDISE